MGPGPGPARTVRRGEHRLQFGFVAGPNPMLLVLSSALLLGLGEQEGNRYKKDSAVTSSAAVFK